MPVPTRQRTALQSDAHHSGRLRANDRGERLRRGGTLALPERLAAAIDHADRGLLQRHVESNVLFHHTPPCSSTVSLNTSDLGAAGGHSPAITPCQLVAFGPTRRAGRRN